MIFAIDKQVPVIDIRPPDEYKAGHIVGWGSMAVKACLSKWVLYSGRQGMRTKMGCMGTRRSVNVPLYRSITGWDFRKFMRRAGFAFFGVFNVSATPACTFSPGLLYRHDRMCASASYCKKPIL